jgi:hypothetical protein
MVDDTPKPFCHVGLDQIVLMPPPLAPELIDPLFQVASWL